ncbi:DUF4880 domain-containing protein [Gluconobacter cerevisiae]|uniref:DUF4880 domain-containing protein n=1 Tax=Gluconobacter cerevisiae TaxID=1379734 RepID=A0ABR9YH26_9PROT|nr:DUF4880 domain-containing protein [Gluconobacter cerevisiae]MBF0877771.1 DUF4880 domain-containing protein [Gluconobacter cerevisiae]
MSHDDTSISSIDAVAFDWVARLDNAPLNISDAAALQRWLTSDVRHRGAFARAQSLWVSAGRMAALQGTPLPAAAAPPSRLTRRALFRTAVAAGIAGTVLLPRRSADASEIYHATSGLMHITQPECGEIVLDQGTILRVRSHTNRPEFDLLTGRLSLATLRISLPINMNGLSIALQPSSKLIAHAAGAESDALVLQGHALSHCQQERRERSLHAKDWIRTTPHSVTVTSLCDEDMERAVAWSEGKLEFQSVDVVDAISELNRYNSRKIILTSSACAHRKISGIFMLDDPLGFARVLREIFGVRLSISKENIAVS